MNIIVACASHSGPLNELPSGNKLPVDQDFDLFAYLCVASI